VPTLTEYYEEVDAKRASHRVVIAGSQVAGVQSVSWNFAIGQVPSASIRLKNPPSASIAYFADVYIEAGFNNVMQRVFTGKVMHVNPDERGCSIECVGKSWPLDFHWHKVIYTFSSVDASVAVAALLTQAGIANFEVNLLAWTIGTVCEQTLEFQTYGEAISKVAEVDGGRWYEMPDGTVRVEVCDQIPALNAWRTYFGMELTGIAEGYPAGIAAPQRPRLRSVKVDQQIREVKNQAFVTGCTYTQTNADGSEDSIEIKGEALAPSPWVLAPDGSQAYNDMKFPNELIDTAVKAGAVAARLVTTKNRLLEHIGPIVDGDPQVFLRGTVGIEDPGYSRVTGRWFTEGYRTTLDERDFATSLDLYGGVEAGSHVTICPMALFSHVGDLEVMGDRLWLVVTFDGRGSVDPDGGALTYSWTDNQAPPIVTGTDPVVTVRADPATLVTPWEVTLTVTDSDGCSDDITLTIPVEPGSEDLYIPALIAAFDQWLSGSPDGGQTWNDAADPGGDPPVFISAGLKIVTDGVTFGVSWGGTRAGAIYKTTDYCATAPTLVMAAVGSPIEHIWPDTNFPPDAWAITRDGRLYRSQDDGDNWVLYDDLRLVFDLPDIRLSRIATPAPDGVWVFGGEGVAPGPLIAFDPTRSHAWAKAVIGGELAADLGGSGGFAPVGVVGAQSFSADYEFLRHDPGDWVEQSATAPASGRYCWIKNLNGTLFRLNCSVGGNLGKISGSLQRSPDDGVTWTEVFAGDVAGQIGIIDFDRAADGTLWAVWGHWTLSLGKPRVYKSINDGLTWTQVYELSLTNYFPVSIACHPTDPLKIAFICRYYSTPFNARLGYTVNGGGAWTEVDCGWYYLASNTWWNQLIWGDSDRLMATNNNTTSMVRISDDFGVTWTVQLTIADTAVNFAQIVRGTSVSEYFLLRYVAATPFGYIARSTDNGWTWNATWMGLLADVGFGASGYALAYDNYADRLYVGRSSTPLAPGAVVKTWNVTEGWLDITDDIATEFGLENMGQGFLCSPTASGTPPAPADIYVREAASREADELAIILDSDSHTPAVYYTWDILSADGAEWSRCVDCPAKPHGRWIAPDLEFGLFCFAFNDNINYRGDVDPVTGIMTATVAPGQLGAGYEAEHGVWIGNLIGGMAGCYIVAALDGAGAVDGFLYKTWDRFETNPVELLRPAAGFPAAPAGARGYMVAFEGQGSGGGPPPHLWEALPIAIVHDVGGATTWDISYPESDYSEWLDVALPANVTNVRPRPHCLTPLLWFVANIPGFPRPDSPECNRQMARSQDGGATWDSIAVGDETCITDRSSSGDEINHFSRIVRDAGGRLWAARQRGTNNTHPIRCEVWYSDDDGDNWTLSTTLTSAGTNQFCIALLAHPTNQAVIALVSACVSGVISDNRVVIHYTADRGASWTTNAPTVASGNNFAHTENGQASRHMMLPNGRLVIVNREFTSDWFKIYTSDNYGLTWQLRYTETLANEDSMLLFRQGQWLANGVHLVGLRVPVSSGVAGMFAVMESVNAGNTWTARVLSEPPNPVYGNNWDAVYDSAHDAFYVQNGDRGTPGTNRVLRLQNATNGGDTWEEFTGDLPWVNPSNMHWEGIALIPSF